MCRWQWKRMPGNEIALCTPDTARFCSRNCAFVFISLLSPSQVARQHSQSQQSFLPDTAPRHGRKLTISNPRSYLAEPRPPLLLFILTIGARTFFLYSSPRCRRKTPRPPPLSARSTQALMSMTPGHTNVPWQPLLDIGSWQLELSTDLGPGVEFGLLVMPNGVMFDFTGDGAEEVSERQTDSVSYKVNVRLPSETH